MSMTLDEAMRAALDPVNSHATVTLDLATSVLARDESVTPYKHALAQLAESKAAIQRLNVAWTPEAAAKFAERIAHNLIDFGANSAAELIRDHCLRK